MKMEIKDSGLYIDMTHDAREYKNRILALNGIKTNLDFHGTMDVWAKAMVDAMQTFDDIAPLDYDPDCEVCQKIMAESENNT